MCYYFNMIKDNVLNLILHAEGEYSAAVKGAVTHAEKYADERRLAHAARMEELKAEFHLFEKNEREKFEKTLADYDARMAKELARAKERLRAGQAAKIDAVGERIKNEVLIRYDRQSGIKGTAAGEPGGGMI